MSWLRSLLLTFGPMGLIGACYVAAAPENGRLDGWSQLPTGRGSVLTPRPDRARLQQTCEDWAEALALDVPETWTLLPRSPFVLAGDLPEADLRELWRSTIAPTVRALSVSYFDQPPEQPILLVVMSDDDSYKAALKFLGHSGKSEYAGLYNRDERRLVLNLSTGEGTLAHELTHALAHADFADMPEWFDEGLASLHEECQFSDDGLRLIGLGNWRGEAIKDPLERNRLPSIADFVNYRFGSRGRTAREYAYARYLCLYLQERQLLGVFYRKCRANATADPTGGWSLLEALGTSDVDQADRDFRRWLRKELKAAAPTESAARTASPKRS